MINKAYRTSEFGPKQVNIYPNPASEFINIDFPAGLEIPCIYALTDIMGKVVKKGEFNSNMNTILFSDQGLVPGIYSINFSNMGAFYTFKIVFLK